MRVLADSGNGLRDFMKNRSLDFCKKWFFEANPSLWFVFGYILIMVAVMLINLERFNFDEANLFTLIWTYLTLLIVHTLINFPRYRLFWKNNQKQQILSSYVHATYQYGPYLLMAVIYDHIILYVKAFSDIFPLIDVELMHMDEVIFGAQPTLWLERFLHPLVIDYFMVAYALFLVYPYFYLFYLYQKNQLPVFHRAMLAQILSLFVALTMFITLPAKGPRHTFEAANHHEYATQNLPEYTLPLQGIHSDFLLRWTGKASLFQLQYDMWNQIERVKTDCLPSMHTCLCLIVLIYAIRYRHLFKWKKVSLAFWIIGNLSLFFSTVYLRYHWVVDVIAGALLAVVIYYLTEYLYARWLQKRKQCGLSDPKVSWLLQADQLRNKSAVVTESPQREH